MSEYVKVTLKEFLDMREAIETNASHAGGSDDDNFDEAARAVRAARAIEKRNQIEPPPYIR